MLITRRVLYALAAGVCAAGSLEGVSRPGGLSEPSSRPPFILPSRSALLNRDVEDGWRRKDGLFQDTDVSIPGTETDGLHKRQAAPARAPTVFSTQTVTSTITAYAGPPVTSTIPITLTTTSTLVAPARRQTTQTLLTTPFAIQQKRADPQIDSLAILAMASSITTRNRLDDVVMNLDDTADNWSQKRKQNQPETVTSVILIVSRTMITMAPTVLVTSTEIVTSTFTPTSPLSTTTSVIVPTSTNPDGSSTTIFSPTASSSKTSATTSSTSPPVSTTISLALNNGTIGGIIVGGIFGIAFVLALFFCCRRRRRKQPGTRIFGCFNALTSASSLGTSEAAEQGIITHQETFGVGTSPPASVVVRSVREEEPPPPTSSTEMTSAVPGGAPRLVLRGSASPLWRPGAMAFSHSNRPSRRRHSIVLGGGDDDDNKVNNGPEAEDDSSGLSSTEVQPPSPVASSDIFGPGSPAALRSARSSFRRPSRDTWLSFATMSMSTMRDTPLYGSGGFDRRGFGGRMETVWRDEDDEDEGWIPSSPTPGARGGRGRQSGSGSLQDERQGRAVRFEDISTSRSRTSGSGSMDGSSAFV